MSDFPRLAKSMSAPLNGFAPLHQPVRAGMVALALAATMLPGANALARGKATAPARTHAATHLATRQSSHAPVNAAHPKSVAAPEKARARHGTKPAESMRFPLEKARLQAPGAHGRSHKRPAEHSLALETQPVVKQRAATASRSTEAAADRATEERVHAWYSARLGSVKPAPQEDISNTGLTHAPSPAVATSNPSHKPEPQPDLSPVARKATSADFNQAVQKQVETVRAATALKSTRSTADDDAAFAEASNIPSTAPTERDPLPFIHGDLLTGAAPAKKAAIVAKAPAATIIRVDPRGDAEVLSASATSPNAIPVRLSAGDAMPMPAPKAATILRSPAPAAGAVLAAANKPKLDPRLADSMTQQAMDEDAEDAQPPAKSLRAETPARPSSVAGVDLSAGPLVKVNLYDTAGKLILLPAMKGSHEILVHQNQMAIADGLDRVEDDNQLADMRRLKLLIALPDTDSMYPDGRLPFNRRFARPWTVRFLNDLALAHFARFHTPLIITSAVRTVAFQRRLVLTNGNAAPPTGEVASPHLYGQAVDIAKHGMSMTELAWMRSYLTPVESSGKIDVEEEFQQACFHLSVYRRYLGLPGPRNTPAPEVAPSRMLQQAKAPTAKRRHIPTALLATGLR